MGIFYSKESKQQLLGYADAHIKPYHKHGMCLIVMEMLFHEDLLN